MQTKEQILASISDNRYSIAMPFNWDMLYEAMELHASQQQGGMRWVKASDRMPAQPGRYNGKRFGEAIALDAREDKNGKMYFAIPNGMPFKGWKEFLWLDESEASPTSQPAQGADSFITIQTEEPYYAVECENCGWIGSSGNCEGGGQIADTGDYNDPLCPCCLSEKVGGADNRQPLTSYVERLAKSSETVKKLTLLLEECHNQLDEKNIDWSQFPEPSPEPVAAQGVEEADPLTALRELVYLKSIKSIPEYASEYEARKEKAWAFAKKAVGNYAGASFIQSQHPSPVKQMMEFTEWAEDNYYQEKRGVWVHAQHRPIEILTTAELYELFIQSKNK